MELMHELVQDANARIGWRSTIARLLRTRACHCAWVMLVSESLYTKTPVQHAETKCAGALVRMCGSA